jgi:predicted exporter
MKIKQLFKVTSIPVLFASLCCLSPLILVMFGLSTVTFAASLSDLLYGQYKWVFRLVGLILLAISITFYLRRQKGICTIDDVKRKRNEVINTIALSVIAGVIGYIFFLYVVVHYVGVFFSIWE